MELPLYLSFIGVVINLSYGILIWLSRCACANAYMCVYCTVDYGEKQQVSQQITKKKSVHINKSTDLRVNSSSKLYKHIVLVPLS